MTVFAAAGAGLVVSEALVWRQAKACLTLAAWQLVAQAALALSFAVAKVQGWQQADEHLLRCWVEESQVEVLQALGD